MMQGVPSPRLALFVIVVLVGVPVQSQSESAGYLLHQSTLSSGGAVSDSASFRLAGTVGQELTIGVSCSNTTVLQSGFWSFAGSGLVPVWLTVDRVSSEPVELVLEWTGNNAPYAVYESSDCADIFGVGPIAHQDEKVLGGVFPPYGLTCYSVVAKAPGGGK